MHVFLFSTDFNKIFHIKHISMQSTKENKKSLKVYICLILNTVLLPEWSTAVFFCLVIVVHESLVCPEQLNCLLFFRKVLQVLHILWFFSIFCAFEPFPTMTFQPWLIHLFTRRTTEGLICIYYRRFKRSLMLQKETQEPRGWKLF